MYTLDSSIKEILATEKGKVVLEKHVSLFKDFPNIHHIMKEDLKSLIQNGSMRITAEIAEKIIKDMNRPIEEIITDASTRDSLDRIEKIRFKAGPSPFDIKPESINLKKGYVEHSCKSMEMLLNGEWQMAAEGTIRERLSGEWNDAIPAKVPGSVHTALFEAGRIPDPTIGTNQRIARKESYKAWWMKKSFKCPEGIKVERIVFGGVCNICTVWLNGQELGSHEGMFGGPEFNISEYLKEENILIVKLEPIPYEPSDPDSTHADIDNISWMKTVVVNNVYGWHYSNLPSLGIWGAVKVCGVPAVEMHFPFITTKDASNGIMGLSIHFNAKHDNWAGVLRGSIVPDNFNGDGYIFEKELSCKVKSMDINLQFAVPNPRLWFPNDLGEQNLYKMKLSFTTVKGTTDYKEFVFGIRTVEMEALPEGPRPDKYEWIFKINGEKRFVKGTGWCTMDPLMDFSRERYQRFISLAKLQHIQMVRAWGCGMPETDDFYDLCSRNGIMVLQEWPTTWNIHDMQPYDVLEETVRLNTLRIRNSASLVMWGAGNESSHPYGKAIDMMGRLSIELDGTRAYHTGEPWGGSIHNYDVYWRGKHLDYNLNMEADFFGEFGLACMPVYESVQRYLEDDEKNVWPPKPDGAFAYHTPAFGRADDLSRIMQYARYFVSKDCSMEEYIIGSQLSQAVGVRHTLERARTRWPDCAGVLYYKMNDNFPAASWSSVDWYGAPKIGHYIFQDAFSPLHACVIFNTVNFSGTPIDFPIFLLDDSDELKNSKWKVVVRVFNSSLQEVKLVEYTGAGFIQSPAKLGKLELTYEETDSTPLLVVTEVVKDGILADRTFYWLNYEAEKGCLFRLPQTHMLLTAQDSCVKVLNNGHLPAVAVNISRPGYLHTFTVSDNYFWLDPGEERIIEVSDIEGVTVSAWNMKG